MKTLIQAAAALFVLAVTIAQAEPARNENLLVSVPDGWEMVTDEKNDHGMLSEFVPKGETAQNWTRMITIQVFHNIPDEVTPKSYLNKMIEAAKEAVQEGTFTVEDLKIEDDSNYPTAAIQWFAGQVKSTDKGEITLIRAIRGQDAFYLIQMAWRQPVFKKTEDVTVPRKQIDEGIEFLRKASVADSSKNDSEKEPADTQAPAK